VLGGPPRKIRDDADGWAVSPDGSLIAFGAGNQAAARDDLWVMGANGEEPRKLVGMPQGEWIWQAGWSPDSRRIAYWTNHAIADRRGCSIESRDLKGGQPIVILSDPLLCVSNFVLWWSPSGRLFYKMADPSPAGGNLWESQVNTRTGEAIGTPKRITSWTKGDLQFISGTADGKWLAVLKLSAQSDVYVGQLEAGGRRLTSARRLTLDERDDLPGAWTPDSKAVLFWSNRNGTFDIFRQSIDQDSAKPVVTGPGDKSWPVVSPDGLWILYIAFQCRKQPFTNHARTHVGRACSGRSRGSGNYSHSVHPAPVQPMRFQRYNSRPKTSRFFSVQPNAREGPGTGASGFQAKPRLVLGPLPRGFSSGVRAA
jgi:Tol biopolymer transport system component